MLDIKSDTEIKIYLNRQHLTLHLSEDNHLKAEPELYNLYLNGLRIGVPTLKSDFNIVKTPNMNL